MHHAIAPFELRLCPSRVWLAWIMTVVTLLAVALTLHASAWLLLPLGWAGWRALAVDGWLPGRARIEWIRVTPSGRMSVCLRGHAEDAMLAGHSVVWPGLLVLNLTVGTRRVSQAIFPDSAPRDAQRRLKVFVRWSGDAPIQSLTDT